MNYLEVFKIFSRKNGSQHIATEYALRGIEELIQKNKIKVVFEFGIGIGTIPYLCAVLDKNINYYGTESNDFCINELNKNLENVKNNLKFTHLNNFEDFDENIKFDLIIIDGEVNNSEFIKSITHKDSIIFIEGDRKSQCDFIKNIFPDSLQVRKITSKRHKSYSPFGSENFGGGYTIFRLNNSLKNKILTLFDKIETSFKYKITRKLR